jgi:hypothetical protein
MVGCGILLTCRSRNRLQTSRIAVISYISACLAPAF